ncbi:homoserine dehydrogenase [Deinococcus radiophilus]|uniref:Homoserine dehydrogenase n=1 Tax=Deinococcus radiophilus TaxID=32062 RepID=A0A3S0L2I6_9DEIO|nr:homoserine dehydrogenase [Deinococcus radiophilus]RTR25442.1 homoserine dehydrogenase [Deinococcus radiophilus]UFA50950.1 homoserine dehydrogenase [Deinococcus radiophilus]
MQSPAPAHPIHAQHQVHVREVTLGLLGCGSVGSAILELLERRRQTFADMGVRIQVAGVLVRDASRPRDVPRGTPLTDDPSFLNKCAVVIEVMGGTERPLELLRPYLCSGRPVITANKALLAECWDDLRPFALAGQLYYEASVMAGTPVIGPMSTVLRASTFQRFQAVVNGTCNFILTRMEQGLDYPEALAEAQALGYAEDPPTLDVGGFDSAHKLAVLARFCADGRFPFQAVSVQGIEHLTQPDIQAAAARGERYKLVAELMRTADGKEDSWEGWQAKVHPLSLPGDHALCSTAGSRNAMLFEGDECGPLLFAGGGAGGMVTASAVVGDLLDWLIGFPGHVPLHGPEEGLGAETNCG